MSRNNPPRQPELLRFPRDLSARRPIELLLPEFVLFVLEQRVAEANAESPPGEAATLNDYVESELVNLITLRDVGELEEVAPGFATAVQRWLRALQIR
jgi:hypothetical protein